MSASRVPMPGIVFGTAWKKDNTTTDVLRAIKAGFRGIDTAGQPRHYSEDLVGAAVAQTLIEGNLKRDELWIQTKFSAASSQDLGKPIPYDADAPIPQQVEQSILSSLKNLQVDHLDSVVMHSPLQSRQATLQAWQALERLVEQGKIGAIGISNIYDAGDLQWLIDHAKVKVSAVQNRLHDRMGWHWDVIDLCQAHGITFQTFWTLTGNYSLLRHPNVAKLSEQHYLTPEQVVYGLIRVWGLTPLCGSTNEQHLEEAVWIGDSVPFKKEDPEVETLMDFVRGFGAFR